MMVGELRQLLASCPSDASRTDYARAVIEDNVLGKSSESSRQRSFRYLRELYGLDSCDSGFRALRRLWELDPGRATSSRPVERAVTRSFSEGNR
jgi:hypothetical protein